MSIKKNPYTEIPIKEEKTHTVPQKRKRWDQMPRRSEPPVNLSHPPSAHRHDHEKTKERYIIIVDKRYET